MSNLLNESPHIRLVRKNIQNAVTEVLRIEADWKKKGVKSIITQGFNGNTYRITIKPDPVTLRLYKLEKLSTEESKEG